MLLAGVTGSAPPFVDLSPVHPLLAAHDVAFDTLQERVTPVPLYTDVDDAVNVTFGEVGFATFTVTLFVMDPPAPSHLREYVVWDVVRLLRVRDLLVVR